MANKLRSSQLKFLCVNDKYWKLKSFIGKIALMYSSSNSSSEKEKSIKLSLTLTTFL